MTDKSRNFRSSYYDKVGFRGVEEKKSLEILINEKPMDKGKLSKFCLRFTLPSIYREYVWQVLLGVIPVNAENHNSILQQRSEHYVELENSLKVMLKIKDDTPKLIIHTLMFLLTEDVLEYDIQKQLSTSKVQSLIVLASLFIELSSSEETAFWLFKNFILHQRKLNTKYKNVSQKEIVETILKKEEDVLFEHLCTTKCFDSIPLDLWFDRVFAEVLHESSIARICDKIIGGSCKILPYILSALLIVRRHLLLPLNDADKMVELLEKNPEDVSELAVNKALELYYTANH
ncbi:hypothetical protein JTE90_020494 [Oedothorax gibbosus]|uniref:TBC1 domain family member 7 n=1 Tax=Oedothorax gibbosus TaxID=931172 RepID=A0AAV6UR76_9ARAC|nr:hypothetical protein JTE90_020494 [Oedothorax gibbosus]